MASAIAPATRAAHPGQNCRTSTDRVRLSPCYLLTIGEAAAVAQLGPHEHRGERTDPKVSGGQGLTGGLASPEAFQLTAVAAQCDVFAKQVGPAGNAPELNQLRQVLRSVKLPGACNF